MSYCRLSDGDVYLYLSVHGGITCCFCAFGGSPTLKTYEDALAHVRKHICAGHDVPEWVIPDIEADRDASVSLEPEEP